MSAPSAPKRVLRSYIKRIKTSHNLSIILVILAAVSIGTYLLVGSHAATPYVSTTADSGTLAAGAATCPTLGASDGTSVVFSPAVPMDGAVSLALSCPGTPFSPTSFWNTPLPADTPVNPNNADYVNAITNQLCYDAFGQTTPMTGSCTTGGTVNGNLNTARWSAPFYVVPANQPRVPIVLNCDSTNCDANPAAENLKASLDQGVPIPANAVPAGGTDAHLAVYQPSSNTLWEFWRLSTPPNNAPGAGLLPWSSTVSSYGDSQWHAVWGGIMSNVSTGNGIFPNPYAGWTTGLPLLGSVIRIEELQAGQIDHDIGIGFGELLKDNVIPANTSNATNGISWPADRSDGTNTSPLAIPEGLRFRLPASLNLTQYAAQHPLTPVAMAIAVAVQKYGFVVDATANGAIGLSLGDPTSYTVAGLPNPYTSGPGVGGVGDKGLFGGIGGDDQNELLMANFPWSQLQALPFNYGEPSSS